MKRWMMDREARRVAARVLVFAGSLVAPAAPVALVVLPATSARADAPEDGNVEVHEFDPKTGESTVPVPERSGVTYLNPGPILSLVGGRQHALGLGLEISAMHFPAGKWASPGYGAFAQGQLYDGKYTRFAFGGQAALANGGVELGLAYRAGDGDWVSTLSVHGALFISVGVLTIALRDTLPLNGFDRDHLGFGSEVAFTVGLKVPIIIQGHDPTGLSVFGKN
jgi:hypothetical protein